MIYFKLFLDITRKQLSDHQGFRGATTRTRLKRITELPGALQWERGMARPIESDFLSLTFGMPYSFTANDTVPRRSTVSLTNCPGARASAALSGKGASAFWRSRRRIIRGVERSSLALKVAVDALSQAFEI